MFLSRPQLARKIIDLASRLGQKPQSPKPKGCALELQEKTRQVLQFLKEKAPQVVSREEIIESVWKGHCFTGEKGLNQAIWNLRKTLGDDAHAPTYIRTVPREGYQWIHTAPSAPTRHPLHMSILAFIPVSVVMLTGGSTGPLASTPITAVNSSTAEANIERIATTAVLQNNNILVNFQSGCRGVILPSEGKKFGQPVLSDNGVYVAFTVHEEASCKTIMLNIDDKSRQEFDYCPIAVI